MNKKILIGGVSAILVVGLVAGIRVKIVYDKVHSPIPVCGGVIREEDVPAETAEASVDENSETTATEIRRVDMTSLYDISDDQSLQKGMCTVVNDAESEEEFCKFFFQDISEAEIIEENNSKVLLGKEGNEKTFVMFYSQAESEYPKTAYGFKYSEDAEDVVGEDEISDVINPLADCQEQNLVKDDNGAIIKVEYQSDPAENGTYNSTGVVFMDEKERPLYREYYVTSGSRVTYYFYDDNGNLTQCLDFGGMPYKGLEDNSDIAIGVDCQIYFFS